MSHPDVEQENSAIEITFQIGALDIRTEAMLYLLFHLIKAPCFATLRTKEQLGYTVWSGVKPEPCGVLSAWFIVQSKDWGPAHLDVRIEAFLETFRNEMLPTYGDKEEGGVEEEVEGGVEGEPITTFEKNVRACISKWSEKDKTLSQRFGRFHTAITSNKAEHEFNTRFARARVLEDGVALEDVANIFDRFIKKGSKERHKLSCHVVSSMHVAKDNSLINTNADRIGDDMKSMDTWKASRTLFPSVISRPTPGASL